MLVLKIILKQLLDKHFGFIEKNKFTANKISLDGNICEENTLCGSFAY